MTLYKGMPNGADPMEYPWKERTDGAVSYATGKVCINRHCGAEVDKAGAYWDKSEGSFCCCACGSSLRFWGKEV